MEKTSRKRFDTFRTPALRAVLVAGAEGTGKTVLVHAVAHAAGATLLDLSPRTTDGKYSGCAAERVRKSRIQIILPNSVSPLLYSFLGAVLRCKWAQ